VRKAKKFIRSIPIDKAMDSTLLAYEMNGEPLPLEHGFPIDSRTNNSLTRWLGLLLLSFFCDTDSVH